MKASTPVGANGSSGAVGVDRATAGEVDVVDVPIGCAPKRRAKSLATVAKKCAVKVSDATRRAVRGADADGVGTSATGSKSFSARVKSALKRMARALKSLVSYEDAHEVREREAAVARRVATESLRRAHGVSTPPSTASVTASAGNSARIVHRAASEDATPLPVPRPLVEMPHGHARAASIADMPSQTSFSGAKRDVEVEETIVDTGEKALLINDPSKRKASIADTVKSTAGTAKDVVAKVVSSAASMKRQGSRNASLTAIEIEEAPPDPPVINNRSKNDRTSLSADSKETDGAGEDVSGRFAPSGTNPFLDDDHPGTSDYEFSDYGVPSPRHRRGNSAGSAGRWSELSYTTSDDGMLRMCHTSLAPTKPRRWTRGDNLGEGSYGNVWLALNGDTGELFALKEVRVGSSNKHRDESIEQLEQEVNVLSRLVHPNIVRYIGITREETALYIFLEYVPGGSIASLVSRFGKFEENVIRVYTRQILIGLAYLHAQRVVHRDIKGANILVEKSGRIKLADFGMAKVLERVSIGKSFKGSACWMAPEVIRQQNAGFEADIWSVGCTVYEMATGSPPWSDCSTQVQIIFKIASSNEIPEIPEHLTSEGKDFLRLCLQRAAASRPDAVTLLDEPFVLDAHKSSDQSVPGLQYDTWATSSQVSYHEDEDVSVRSLRSNDDEGLNSRVSSSRHVAWGDVE